MCWSAEVSLATVVLHAVAISWLFCRNRYGGTDRWMVPLLMTVLGVELLEYFLWPAVTTSVLDPSVDREACSPRNAYLTQSLVVLIGAQPFLANLAAYKTGNERQRLMFVFPIAMSLVFYVGQLVAGYLGSAYDFQLVDFVSTGRTDYRGRNACTYIGEHGHLHWVMKLSGHVLLPNAFPYFVLLVIVIFVQPFRLVGAIITIMLCVFTFFYVRYGYSFEAGSVWCWTALLMDLYLLIGLPLLEHRAEKRTEREAKVL